MKKILITLVGTIALGSLLISGFSKATQEQGEIVRVSTSRGLEAWHCVQIGKDKFICEISK